MTFIDAYHLTTKLKENNEKWSGYKIHPAERKWQAI